MPKFGRKRSPVSSLDPLKGLPRSGYYRSNPADPDTKMIMLAIYYDTEDRSVYIIPPKDYITTDPVVIDSLSSITRLRQVAQQLPFGSSLTPEEAEELIATYGENTQGMWVEPYHLTSWFYAYDPSDFTNVRYVMDLDQILNNLQKEIE